MPDFKPLDEAFGRFQSFILTTHVNPDADALGSVMALYRYLTGIGKEVLAVNHSATPYFLTFLDPDDVIKQYVPEQHDETILAADCIIFLDLNVPSRTVKLERVVTESKAYKICLDHHREPADAFDLVLIDVEFSSTGELLFDYLYSHLRIPLTKEIAVPLYAAIMTDTGSFRFDRTSPKVHRIAARLLEAGVEPHCVYDAIYDQNRFSKLQLLGLALSSISLAGGGRIAVMRLSSKDMESVGAVETETDGFVNFCMSIQGVSIGLLILELRDGFKVSFRSKGTIPVDRLAREFGGGGHRNAAGLRIRNAVVLDYYESLLGRAEFYLAIKDDSV